MKFKNIKFSVILPILERKDITETFPYALESIYKNTLKPDQVIVVIDGLVSSYFKEQIFIFEKKYSLDLLWCNKKIGLDKALNLALKRCKNEIVFRADGDDLNVKSRFEMQIPYLLSGYDVVGSNIDEYDDQNNYIGSKKVPISNGKIKNLIPFRNPINHMTVGYLKTSVLEVGGYPELFLKGDYGLWIKLAKEGAIFHNIDNILVNAEGGNDLFRRRSGIKSAYAEYELQSIFFASGLKTLQKALIDFFIRAFFLSLPFPIIKNIYKFILRNPLKKSNQKL